MLQIVRCTFSEGYLGVACSLAWPVALQGLTVMIGIPMSVRPCVRLQRSLRASGRRASWPFAKREKHRILTLGVSSGTAVAWLVGWARTAVACLAWLLSSLARLVAYSVCTRVKLFSWLVGGMG